MSQDKPDRPRPSRKRRFARFVAKLALLAVAAVWLVQEAWGETTWWSAYFTYAPPVLYLALPAAAALVAALCLDRTALLWALVGVALWLVALAPLCLGFGGGKPSADTIRVVSWNLHGELARLDEIRGVLESLEPDIVCLQEANDHQFEACMPGASSARSRDCMLLTTGEILDRAPVGPEQSGTYRRPLEATVELPQGKVRVLNAHLYSFQLAAALKSPSRARAKRLTQKAVDLRTDQVGTILDWLDEQTGPAIVAGDFNNPPRGKLYDKLRDRLTDSFAEAGWGFGWSFPHKLPVLRIDYVWTSDDLTPVSCKIIDTGPSDHRPVVADIALD